VDKFFARYDQKYNDYRNKLNNLGRAYEEFSKMFYLGKNRRQMILGDLLAYILVSRGCMYGYTKANRKAYLKIILYTINQLLLQGPTTTKEMIDVRKDLMETMEQAGLPGFLRMKLQSSYTKEQKLF